MSDDPIEAYGINDVVGVEAIDGLVIIEAVMRGGTVVRFGLQPRTAWKLRPLLRDAERTALVQKEAINRARGLHVVPTQE
jgi:chromosome condensin MukBEF MukE localization factor